MTALIMLAGIYYGAQYGGSITAILVNIPGEPSSAVTAISIETDGFCRSLQEVHMPMTKPVSDTFTTDRIMPATKIEEGIKIVKAQLASATVLPQKIWETQFALASEILTFMGRRMQAQAEFCAQLGRCREISEAVDAQQDFAKGVSGAYADEAERLSALTRKNMDAWSGVGAQYASSWVAPRKAAA